MSCWLSFMLQGSGQSRIMFSRDFDIDTPLSETYPWSSISRAPNVHFDSFFDSLRYKPAFMRNLRTKRNVPFVILLSLRINNQIVPCRLSRTRPDIRVARSVWLTYD